MALRRLAEERQDGLVLEHFRAAPAPEQRGDILETADLGSRLTELQCSPDIFGRMLARQFVCTHRVRQMDGERAHRPAREWRRELKGAREQ
jgi:hypothetical protein